MNGELVITDYVDDEIFEFEMNPSSYDFSLSVYVNENKTLEQQLKDVKKFNKCINYMRMIAKDEMNFYDEEEKEIDYVRNNLENILDSCEYVRFLFNDRNIKEYLRDNPELLNKKIVLSEILEITDYDKLMSLMYEYIEIVDKVYVTLVDNSKYVSLSDCYKTMSVIKKEADEIKALDLSQMETIMYVYDKVRNRVYTHENEEESLFKSRDLTEVMFGDKIVCAGYANIFHTLLSYLGIKSSIVRLIDKNDKTGRTGHARNVIYVQDDKYTIDGVYYFDPTWDSKRKEETNEYLYRYNNFAKTRSEVEEDKRYNFEDTNFDFYTDDYYEIVKDIIDRNNISELDKYFKSINRMSTLVDKGILLKALEIVPTSPLYGCFDKEEFLNSFKEICDKFNKRLSAETMIDLLNNVRKVEYYNDPEHYFYSLDNIYKTFVISKWKFKENHVDEAVEKLFTVLGIDIKEEMEPIEIFKNYIREIDLFRDINQVKLTKILQKKLNQ